MENPQSFFEGKKVWWMNVDTTREDVERLAKIREREHVTLRAFFGKDIAVPPVPDEITPERYGKWKKIGFELHYLPPEELRNTSEYPGWKKKPGQKYVSGPNSVGKAGVIEFLQYAEGSVRGLTPQNLKLPGAWVLTDEREKPYYDNSIGAVGYTFRSWKDKPYSIESIGDKNIGGALRELREKGIISTHKKNTSSRFKNDMSSRFNISRGELGKPEVRAKLAEVLGVKTSYVRLPRVVEWSFIGNAYHLEWGESNSQEWFEDLYSPHAEDTKSSYKPIRSLMGGEFQYGGLSNIYAWDSNRGLESCGFRPIVVFSNQ